MQKRVARRLILTIHSATAANKMMHHGILVILQSPWHNPTIYNTTCPHATTQLPIRIRRIGQGLLCGTTAVSHAEVPASSSEQDLQLVRNGDMTYLNAWHTCQRHTSQSQQNHCMDLQNSMVQVACCTTQSLPSHI